MAKEKQNQSQVVLYHTPDGKVTVNVLFARDNFWLTQRSMADLFGVKTSVVSRHLKNIYASSELAQEATVSKMETVQTEGGRQISREVEYYNPESEELVGNSGVSILETTAADGKSYLTRFYNLDAVIAVG